tara:strand:+ start:215847 stop:216554 length:708 start_codon:yes stop_codon:yes gene_type:complete
MRLSINSIYKATEGEGVLVGSPQIFIRFQGCNIGCINCDSKDTWDFLEKGNITLEETLEKLKDLGGEKIKRVSITGGDPLHPSLINQTLKLVKELKARRYWVNIEAAGTRLPHELFDQVDFISFDYKTPSTGVKTNQALLKKLIEQYPGRHQIKSVVAHQEDFDNAYKSLINMYGEEDSLHLNSVWVITPCYEPNEEFNQQRFQEILKWNEDKGGPFRVIGQQHKWVYGPSEKQV